MLRKYACDEEKACILLGRHKKVSIKVMSKHSERAKSIVMKLLTDAKDLLST